MDLIIIYIRQFYKAHVFVCWTYSSKLYQFILYFTFLFSLFVLVSAAGQYNVIWTGTGLPRFRNGTCIIILDKKYNIANSSYHFGSYGSIWTGPSPKKYYMDLRSFGPYNIFLVSDRSIYCHMTFSAMNYLLYILLRVPL